MARSAEAPLNPRSGRRSNAWTASAAVTAPSSRRRDMSPPTMAIARATVASTSRPPSAEATAVRPARMIQVQRRARDAARVTTTANATRKTRSANPTPLGAPGAKAAPRPARPAIAQIRRRSRSEVRGMAREVAPFSGCDLWPLRGTVGKVDAMFVQGKEAANRSPDCTARMGPVMVRRPVRAHRWKAAPDR